jgi:hypothetical protein
MGDTSHLSLGEDQRRTASAPRDSEAEYHRSMAMPPRRGLHRTRRGTASALSNPASRQEALAIVGETK